MHQRHYRILNTRLLLESDSDELLDIFHRDYAWFETGSPDGGSCMRVSFCMQGNGTGPFLRTNLESPTLNMHPETCSMQHAITFLKEHPAPVGYAYQAVNRILMEEARDFVILHGGGIAMENRAVIICGPPGSGKTTLVMALLEKGFFFLSDDFCPIHRETRLVHPFPRSLWLSPQSRFAPCNTGAPAEGGFRSYKVPLQPDRAGIAIAEKPCRLKALICLDPGRNTRTDWCELVIGLKEYREKTFLEEAGTIPGVILEKAGACEWRLKYPRQSLLTGKVQGLLSKHRDSIWNVFRVSTIRPDFSGVPALGAMAVHEAAFFVLQELKQRPDFYGQAATKAGEYFMQLNEMLQGVSCYRLTCGRLDRLKELVKVATK